jgi:hypothetical protein
MTEAESKIWHAHLVRFLDGNPILGYSKQKAGWPLMLWSGDDDKNIVKRKGQLERFK